MNATDQNLMSHSLPHVKRNHCVTSIHLWRQGQSAGTVVIQHIVTKGTIDERILKVLQAKDKTQAALIEAVKADLKI